MHDEQLICVEAKHFVAGFCLQDDRVTRAAPILRKHLLGKTADEARKVIAAKGWRAFHVKPHGTK